MADFKGYNNVYLNVDIKRKNYYYFECNQNDDIHLVLYLYENGVSLNLSDTDTYTIKYVNANNTITNNDMFGGGHSNNDNILSIYFPRNCTLSSGTAHMQVTLNKSDNNVNNKQTSTFPIDIKIIPSVIQGQEVSQNATNLVNNLDEANKKGQEIINNIKDTETKYPSSTQLYKDVQSLKEIGIRNLFRYSRDFSKYWTVSNATIIKNDGSSNSNYRGLTEYTTDKNWGGLRQTVELEKGKTYTLGVYLKCNVSGVRVDFYCTVPSDTTKNYGGLVTNNVSLDTWQRYTVTFIAEETDNTDIRVEPTNIESKGGLLEVCGYTLVEGLYSPQDFFESIDDVYRKQLYSTDDILEQEEGLYQGVCINSPNDSNNWLYEVKEYRNNSNYKKVIAYNVSTHDILENTKNNGTWSGWIHILTSNSKIPATQITGDSTHRFATDSKIKMWDKAATVYVGGGDGLNNPNITCNTVGYDHIDIYFTATNKTNISDFTMSVNGNVVNTETGGGVIYMRYSANRAGTSSWVGILEVAISATSSGAYTEQRLLSVNEKDFTNITFQCTTASDTFSNCTIVLKGY